MTTLHLLRAGLALAVLCAAAEAAEIYRWQQDGQWHYGHQPPPGADAEPVREPPPPELTGAEARARVEQLRGRHGAVETERREAAGQRLRDWEHDEQRKENCLKARQQLETLVRHPRLRTPDGELIYGERRAELMDEYQQRATRLCQVQSRPTDTP